MKKNSILITCFLSIFSSTLFAAIRYEDRNLNYSFSVPEGWMEIPAPILEAAVRRQEKNNTPESPQFITGYQKNSTKWFSHPYFLVQNYPGGDKTIRKLIADIKDVEGIEKKVPHLRGTEFGKPQFDRERKMFFFNTQSEIVGIGPTKSMTTIHPGKNGLASFLFFDKDSEYEANISIFKAVVLDSFSFKPGFEYSWTNAVSKSVSPSLKLIYRNILIGALTGILIIVIFLVLTLKKKNKSFQEDTNT